MLLTSAQVSFAVSSAVVVSFTLALFLSGYAIQQRTLRDLRAAIRQPPRPSPKIFLPDRFRKQTTELADGTVVVLGGDDDDDDGGQGVAGLGAGSGVGAKEKKKDGEKKSKQAGEGVVIEVKASGVGEDDTVGRDRDEGKEEQQAVMVDDEEEDPDENDDDDEEEEQEEDDGAEGDGNSSVDEVKDVKLVQSDPKWEPWKAQKGAKNAVRDNSVGLDLTPTTSGKTEKPISRAERRRRIKAEIQRLAQGDTPIYYQRRLW